MPARNAVQCATRYGEPLQHPRYTGASAGIGIQWPAAYLWENPRQRLTGSEARTAQEVLRTICASPADLANVAIRFARRHPAVTGVAARASSVVQVEPNATAPDSPPLADSDLRLLGDAVRQLRYSSHRWELMPRADATVLPSRSLKPFVMHLDCPRLEPAFAYRGIVLSDAC
jgi:hypothetical protein